MLCHASAITKSQLYNKKAALQARLEGEWVHGEACLTVAASMTIEAAIVFPIFIFAIALMLLPFRIMETTGRMQEACEELCRDVCQHAYAAMRVGADLDPENSPRDQALYTGISAGLGAYAAQKARDAADDQLLGLIDFIDSDCMTDGETVTIVLNYTYRLPFSVLGYNSINQTVTSSRRAWVGKKRSKSDGESSDADPLVYVGKSSTRYHLSQSCHYLSNNMKSVEASQIGTIRNSYNGKYHPCSVCAKNGVSTGSVYVMASGNAYHTQRNCKAIVAYVKTVHLSEVESMGACSYCGR